MKRLALIFTLLAFGLTAQAQPGFGIKAGATLSDFRYTVNDYYSEPEHDPLAGVMLAALVDYKLTDMLTIQAEPGFVQRGATCYVGNDVRKQKFRINYLNLPLVAAIGTKRIGAEAGFEWSYLLSTNREQIMNTASFDYGPTGGLYVGLTDKLFLNARYYYGLNKGITEATFADEQMQIQYIEDANSSWSFSVSYKF